MNKTRNKLPPKERYDDSVPDGTPLEQWIWLLNEWLGSSYAFARTVRAELEALAAVSAKSVQLQATQSPSIEAQEELLAQAEETAGYRPGIYGRYLSADEAADELLSMQESIAKALNANRPERLAVRTQRVEARVAEIEREKDAFEQRFKEVAAEVYKACPDYSELSGKYPMIAFYIRDHLGGPQPKGWVTVSSISDIGLP